VGHARDHDARDLTNVIGTSAAEALSGETRTRPRYDPAEIEIDPAVPMRARDGVTLVSDVYRPRGVARLPTILARTPYGRETFRPLMLALAQHGFACVAQDCRGTGASEPDHWDMYVYEPEDSYDLVEWVTGRPWYDGGIGGVGGSYAGETQWCMAFHPAMTAIAPEVGGIGRVMWGPVKRHMFANAYIRSVGKGETKVPIPSNLGSIDDHPLWATERAMLSETLATGYFDAPIEVTRPRRDVERYPELADLADTERRSAMWRRYAAMTAAERAGLLKFLADVPEVNYRNFGDYAPVFGDIGASPAFLYVKPSLAELYGSLRAPALILTGWYDWSLMRVFETWELMQRHASEHVRDRSMMIIGPYSHRTPGYREGSAPTLSRTGRGLDNLELLLRWYGCWLRHERSALGGLAPISYFLMGANVWDGADRWPPLGARSVQYYLQPGGGLAARPPGTSDPDTYVFDPHDPTPTKGGSIISTVITPGSTDVSDVQRRADVLAYTTEPLARPVRVVGPMTAMLHAASSAVDTDFVVRLTDVHPDGRALQIQNGVLRARFREPGRPPSLIEPGRVYRFEVGMWATAHEFAAGHRLRIDISSADFPRFERNSGRGGAGGPPIAATQTIFHDPARPSHVILSVVGG
jgi:hypothetical protein